MTLAGRIAHLVLDREVPPASILAITFTTAAAAALRSRLEAVLASAAGQVDIRTFHSFGLKVIRAWSEELGFRHLPPAVYGRDDVRALICQAARGLGVDVVADADGKRIDDWSLSAARVVRALYSFRLSERTGERAWVDPGGLDEALLRELTAAYESLLQHTEQLTIQQC